MRGEKDPADLETRMDADEASPLLGKTNSHDNGHLKQGPFLVCVTFCATITFLVMFVSVSASPIVSQYVHEKLLHKYHGNTTTGAGGSACTDNTNSTSNNNNDDPLIRAQEETSNFLLLLAVTNTIPAVFVNVVLGSCSDYLGRRMMFFIPGLGFVLKNVFCTFIVYFEMDIQYFYLAYAIEGFGGAACAFIAASFSYIADITTGRGRILATTGLETCLAMSACIGSLVTGFLIPAIGYVYLSIIMAGTVLIACILIVFLPETRKTENKTPWSLITHFKNVFGFYVAKGKEQDGKRPLYILILSIFMFSVLSILGRLGIETLYGLNRPFCWNSTEIGFFGALRIGLASLGALITIKLLQRRVRDETIALIGAVDSLIGCTLEGFATTGWMLYLVPVVGMVGSTTVPIIRGSMSRMTSPHEQGAVFAGIGFVETILNLLCQVLYMSVYSATVATVRGAVFFIMAGFSGITAVLIIVWRDAMPRFQNAYEIHIPAKEECVSITKESDLCDSQSS